MTHAKGGPGPHDAERTLSLSALAADIWRRRWIVVFLTLVMAVIAYGLVSRITPQFTARASVMLDPRSVQVMSSDEIVSDLTLNNPVVFTEVAVMRTNVMLGVVLESFHPDELAPLDPALDPPGMASRIKTRVRSLIGSLTGRDTESTVQLPPSALAPEERRMRRLLSSLRRAMQVWREPDSYIISVSVTTKDPSLSMQLANRIVETYVTRQLEQRTNIVRNATAFLEQRVERMQADVEDRETNVESFRRTQLARSGVSLETLERQLLDLGSQLAVARADLASIGSRTQQIQTVIETDGIESAAEFLSSALVVSLRDELLALKREDAELSAQFGPDYPERLRTRRSVELVNQDLSAEVRNIVANLKNDETVARIRVETLQLSIAEIERKLSELSQTSLELRQLEREAEAIRANYQATLERLTETRATEELQQADAQIVEIAHLPGGPSAPRTTLFTVLGGTVGFTTGLIICLFMSIGGTGYRRSSEIEMETGLKVVASLPRTRWKSFEGMLQNLSSRPHDIFAERLRLLRSSGALASSEGTGTCVMVTSAVPIEGKSTTILAIAQIEAMARRKCIVLDFDLHRSNFASALGYAPLKGDLADYLHQRCTLEGAIHRVDGVNFDLLSLHRPAPQLSDEIPADRIKQLIDILTKRYDLVLIDTPPVLSVSEALTISPFANRILFLVRQQNTHRQAVQEAINDLREVGSPQIRIVMTMVDPYTEKDAYGTDSRYSYSTL